MKKIAVISTLLIITFCCNAQDKKDLPTAPKSKLEAFSEKSGTMVKKDFLKIAELHSVSFEVLTITDLTTNETIQGLRISTSTSNGSYMTNYVAFLDKDEIDGFLKAIIYMSETVIKSDIPVNYVEYTFTSKSGFKASVFNGKGVFSSKQKWQSSFQLEEFLSNSAVMVPIDDLPKIKDAIIFAQAKLTD